jgi:PAS domain S-box-containing protein
MKVEWLFSSTESSDKTLGFIERLKIPALIIVILTSVLTLLIYITNINIQYEPKYLNLVLYLIFLGISSFIIAYVTSRGFLRTGSWPLLWLGVGAITFGLANIFASFLVTISTPNIAVTTSNLNSFLASIFYIIGGFFIINKINPAEDSNRLFTLLQVYISAFALITVITLMSINSLFPPFFIQGTGGTIIREFIIIISAIFFFLSSLLILKTYWDSKSLMLYWYGLGLLLITLGLIGLLFIQLIGSPFNWAARGLQLLGGVYLLIATYTVFQTAKVEKISASDAIADFFSMQKSYLHKLLDNINEAVILYDSNFKISGWNSSAENMYGWKSKEMIGKSGIDYLKMYPLDMSELNSTNEVFPEEGWHGEVIQKRRNMTDINILSSISPLKNEKGLFDGFIIINRNITDIKQNEEKMKITLDELKRSNEELERFAYVSSHDLQEPLRMVTLYSQLLERRYKDRLDSDANDFIEYIVENAKRMKQLIDDLLEYSRLTNRAKEFENIDLEKVLENVLSNLSILIVENNVTVTHDSLPTVLADENQMMQVFQNLITNAIKFRGVEPPKIDISAKKNEKEWIFAIKDNGIGINPEHQEQIFEVFKRLHTQEEYPGTGIGLSIVQKIILHHHGRIWAESEPGKGSTFYFTIPTINNSGQHTFIIS